MVITKRRVGQSVPVVAPAPLRRVWGSVFDAARAINLDDPRRLYHYLTRDEATGWWRLEPESFYVLLSRHRNAMWPDYREERRP
jgi:hypothetical protein